MSFPVSEPSLTFLPVMRTAAVAVPPSATKRARTDTTLANVRCALIRDMAESFRWLSDPSLWAASQHASRTRSTHDTRPRFLDQPLECRLGRGPAIASHEADELEREAGPQEASLEVSRAA